MLEAAMNNNAVGASVTTVMGYQGLGKTTLAATWPSPFFIWTEDGSKAIPADSNARWIPNEAGTGPKVCKSHKEVLEQIKALAKEDHGFETLVIDTITQLNTIIEGEIVAGDEKARSINQAGGGYGAGYSQAAAIHKTIRDWCEYLKESKGMHIVFVAHSEFEQITPPDADPYSRHTLRINKKSVSHYSDNVDLVAHVKHKILVSGASKGKAGKAMSGGRVIVAYASPSSISKNRYGIDQDLPYEKGHNPLAKFIIGGEK
jgi:hypothetical protein